MMGDETIGAGHRQMLILTWLLQAAVAYVPLSLLHAMGYRFLYSGRVYGWTGPLVMVLLLVGLPSLALWQGYFAARRKETVSSMWTSYALRLVPTGAMVLFAAVLTVASGIR